MTLTFQKIKWEDVPEALRQRIISWSDKEIIIDDTGLTAAQVTRLTNYMLQEGHKAV